MRAFNLYFYQIPVASGGGGGGGGGYSSALHAAAAGQYMPGGGGEASGGGGGGLNRWEMGMPLPDAPEEALYPSKRAPQTVIVENPDTIVSSAAAGRSCQTTKSPGHLGYSLEDRPCWPTCCHHRAPRQPWRRPLNTCWSTLVGQDEEGNQVRGEILVAKAGGEEDSDEEAPDFSNRRRPPKESPRGEGDRSHHPHPPAASPPSCVPLLPGSVRFPHVSVSHSFLVQCFLKCLCVPFFPGSVP